MAITVDSATVAQVTSATGTGTTATFSVPADTVIVVLVGYNAADTDAAGSKVAASNNKSLTVTEPVERGHRESAGQFGGAAIAYMYSAGAQTGMTVTCALTGVSATSDDLSFKVLLLSGCDSTSVSPDTPAEGATTTNAPALSVTASTVADGIALWAVNDWAQTGVPTWTGTGIVSAGTYNVSGQVSGGFAYLLFTGTGTKTATYDAAGTGATNLAWAAAIIQAAAGVSAIPPILIMPTMRR